MIGMQVGSDPGPEVRGSRFEPEPGPGSGFEPISTGSMAHA